MHWILPGCSSRMADSGEQHQQHEPHTQPQQQRRRRRRRNSSAEDPLPGAPSEPDRDTHQCLPAGVPAASKVTEELRPASQSYMILCEASLT